MKILKIDNFFFILSYYHPCVNMLYILVFVKVPKISLLADYILDHEIKFCKIVIIITVNIIKTFRLVSRLSHCCTTHLFQRMALSSLMSHQSTASHRNLPSIQQFHMYQISRSVTSLCHYNIINVFMFITWFQSVQFLQCKINGWLNPH